jgi:hypothetical protein
LFPGLKPRSEPSRPLRGEEASQILLNLAPFYAASRFALLAEIGSNWPGMIFSENL